MLKKDFIGIYGESGVGKSTFVDILSGLLDPTQGKISINNKYNIKESFLYRNNLIGYVPQNIYLNDESVSSNIAFGVNHDEINNDLIDYAIDNAKLRNLLTNLNLEKTRL